MRNENLLIIYSSGYNNTEELPQEIKKLVDSGFDWDYFLRQAKRERVTPLIYKFFSGLTDSKDKIPQKIREKLSSVYYSIVRQNLLICETLEKLVFKLAREGIQAIFFKGIVLADLVYADLGLRQMSDLDMLIRREDLKKTHAKLAELGYSASFLAFNTPLNPYRNSCLYHNPRAYPEYIHIYWHIINIFCGRENFRKINLETLWRNAVEVKLSNKTRIYTFCPTHQLLYLCLHALNHAYQPLRTLCDINALINKEKNNIAWDALIEEANLLGMERCLYYGLLLSREIFRTDIPISVLASLQPEGNGFFQRWLISRMISRKTFSDHTCFLINLFSRQKLIDKYIFIREALLPSRVEMAAIRQKDISQVTRKDYLRRWANAFTALSNFIIK